MENELKTFYHNSFEDGCPCPTCGKNKDGMWVKIEGKEEIFFCSWKCAELYKANIKV